MRVIKSWINTRGHQHQHIPQDYDCQVIVVLHKSSSKISSVDYYVPTVEGAYQFIEACKTACQENEPLPDLTDVLQSDSDGVIYAKK
jgi:hypothetical protein